MNLAWRHTVRFKLTMTYAAVFVGLGVLLTLVIVLGSRTNAVSVAVPGPLRRISVVPGGIIRQQQLADNARVLLTAWFVLALTALISIPLGWFASGRMLRPLRQMTARTRTISAGNLHERLALTGPADEFKELGDTLDQLLARLEASFEAQRRFVANASHELRTPLAVERTLIQVALADPDVSIGTLRATCEELLAAGREQEQLLDALLALAAGEHGIDRSEPIDLAQVAGPVVRTAELQAKHAEVELSSELSSAPMTGDGALLERLIANLVDNAVHHNHPGGTVTVRTSSEDGRAVLSVTNSGPMVETSQVEHLFEPFQRGAGRVAAQEGHHGLGLSIVRAIAVTHGAKISAVPNPGGGLSVTVTFPAP